MLDPGGYGALTITKSITINGDGTLASITSALVNGIIINAPAGSVVTIRNISINGVGTGLNGIRILSASQVTIDKVDIAGFTQSGIDINSSISTLVAITNSHVRTSANGVRVQPNGAPRTDVAINWTTLKGNTNGVQAAGNSLVSISHSNITHNPGTGLLVSGGGTNVEDTMFSGNGTGANATGGVLRLSNSSFYENGTNLGCGPGSTQTTGNNRVNGTVPGCTPNGGAVPVM